ARLLTWANVGFGQGIAASGLQMLTAAAAIANGGELLKPYLVKAVLGPDGEPVKVAERQVVGRPISSETSAEMREILRSVVVNGSGTRADVPGYRVAGKTGTAQIASPTGGYL